jgi:hypothetical protein
MADPDQRPDGCAANAAFGLFGHAGSHQGGQSQFSKWSRIGANLPMRLQLYIF